jgi:hypothetical protein
MEKQFEILKANRILLLKTTTDLTLEQVNKIPDGFQNNIIWNMGHLVVVQQLLNYKLSNLPMYINDDFVKKYAKGGIPKGDVLIGEFEMIKEHLLSLVDKLKDDYNSKKFKIYNSYLTSPNVNLTTIEEAIQFNNFHEGIHLGFVLALKKLV